ncbi:cbb3-type cytochrome c oxidase subunit 3 [Aeoliella sp. SH292]|uniref:cbb3-type cytochrome c oxidase subunit 3 n=1 Tax=Aeoliella sp. SH292 TaxID=3454464 RepID=UPI003F9AF4AF
MNWLQTDAAIDTIKTTGLVMFVAIFVGVLIWLAMRKQSDIDRWSKLPLDDDSQKHAAKR